MTTSPAPLELDTVLSPEWLSATLGRRVVAAREVESVTTIASKVRFEVDYAEATDLPRALCVKGYFADQSRSFAAVGQIEACFYAELAPTLDVRVPGCLHAAIDSETGHGIVLMHDLVAEGARFLTALSPYSVDDVAGTLEQLARLHTAPVSGAPWMAPRLSGYLDAVSEARLQELFDDGRGAALQATTRDARRVRRAFGSLVERVAGREGAMIHGDAHAGNLFLDAHGRPGLVDWQLVQRGPWELDFAYHVVAVLDEGERERNERALLRHYLAAVSSAGGDPPAESEAWDRYRDALAYGYYLWGITQRVERPVIEVFVDRLGAAVEAHDTLDRLGA